MVVVCDTCALIMLLRIAPEMFEDVRYGCITIHNVWEEFTRNARIGREYPWRSEMKSHVRSIPQGDLETETFRRLLQAVQGLERNSRNQRTGELFNLSPTDKRLAATCLDRELDLCTAEYNLDDFMRQEFDRENVPPLQLVNAWIGRDLITWNDERQSVIEDWITQHERPQPQAEIRRFEKLTGGKYPD